MLCGQKSPYPTPCKGRYITHGNASYLFEEPVGLNAIDILPQLKAAGVTALKIEGRQRSRAYVTEVVSAFRKAIDALAAGVKVAALYRRVLNGKTTPNEAIAELKKLTLPVPFVNGFLHAREGLAWVEAEPSRKRA